jgi:hypothetical protein
MLILGFVTSKQEDIQYPIVLICNTLVAHIMVLELMHILKIEEMLTHGDVSDSVAEISNFILSS